MSCFRSQYPEWAHLMCGLVPAWDVNDGCEAGKRMAGGCDA